MGDGLAGDQGARAAAPQQGPTFWRSLAESSAGGGAPAAFAATDSTAGVYTLGAYTGEGPEAAGTGFAFGGPGWCGTEAGLCVPPGVALGSAGPGHAVERDAHRRRRPARDREQLVVRIRDGSVRRVVLDAAGGSGGGTARSWRRPRRWKRWRRRPSTGTGSRRTAPTAPNARARRRSSPPRRRRAAPPPQQPAGRRQLVLHAAGAPAPAPPPGEGLRARRRRHRAAQRLARVHDRRDRTWPLFTQTEIERRELHAAGPPDAGRADRRPAPPRADAARRLARGSLDDRQARPRADLRPLADDDAEVLRVDAAGWPWARPLVCGETPMPVSRKRLSRMFARWPGECIQTDTTARGVPSQRLPQPMFSPTSKPRRELEM